VAVLGQVPGRHPEPLVEQEDGVSTPVEGGRGLRLRLFGFPVHVDLSFVLIMGLLGYVSGVRGWDLLLLWIAVATVAILIHELGHAVVARTTRARPAIALTGFGGLTTYVPPAPLTRARSFAISVAGPGVGLAAAAVLWLVANAVEPTAAHDSYLREGLRYGLFTTFWWSVLNLLPILPLDGGQAMREVLPGDPRVRLRRAALVSIIVIAPLLVLALIANQLWLGMFLLFFGVANVQTLRETSDTAAARTAGNAAGAAAGSPQVTPEQAVVGLLWQGAPVQARQLLESLPQGTSADLAVHGAVLAATDQPEQGLALLQQEVARRPTDPNVVALLVLAHTLRHDWAAVEADLTGPLARAVPLALVERAIQEATAAGHPDVAGRIAALPRPHS
jgi:stage IV sporulation protein FB